MTAKLDIVWWPSGLKSMQLKKLSLKKQHFDTPAVPGVFIGGALKLMKMMAAFYLPA